MQILIGCAKTMTGNAPSATVTALTEPVFQSQANHHALQLATYSASELGKMLRVNPAIATENYHRYQDFFIRENRQPAVFCYDGMVFKKIAPETMSKEDLEYSNDHLMIASFLYGLLRPLDLVSRYRLEADVQLPENGGASMLEFWKPLLTDHLIKRVKADDGILVNLASEEFQGLFDYKRILRELRVITPEFKVEKGGKLKTIVIYTKMCRGAMTRWILENRTTAVEQLEAFEYEGYALDRDSGRWLYVNR